MTSEQNGERFALVVTTAVAPPKVYLSITEDGELRFGEGVMPAEAAAELHKAWQDLRGKVTEIPKGCDVPISQADRKAWLQLSEVELFSICNPKNVRLLIQRFEATIRAAESKVTP